MPQDLFSSPPGDDEEPGRFPLPPEQLTLAGFAQGGQADTMTPGPLLSTVVHTVSAAGLLRAAHPRRRVPARVAAP